MNSQGSDCKSRLDLRHKFQSGSICRHTDGLDPAIVPSNERTRLTTIRRCRHASTDEGQIMLYIDKFIISRADIIYSFINTYFMFSLCN